MRKLHKYVLVVLATAVAAAGCKNDEYDNRSPFDNVVYLDVAGGGRHPVDDLQEDASTLERTFRW